VGAPESLQVLCMVIACVTIILPDSKAFDRSLDCCWRAASHDFCHSTVLSPHFFNSWTRFGHRHQVGKYGNEDHPRQMLLLVEPERSSSFPVNWERNDPGNAGHEMNPGNNQAHFVHVKIPAMMRHEISHNMIK
jgi:hypothetical protein